MSILAYPERLRPVAFLRVTLFAVLEIIPAVIVLKYLLTNSELLLVAMLADCSLIVGLRCTLESPPTAVQI